MKKFLWFEDIFDVQNALLVVWGVLAIGVMVCGACVNNAALVHSGFYFVALIPTTLEACAFYEMVKKKWHLSRFRKYGPLIYGGLMVMVCLILANTR